MLKSVLSLMAAPSRGTDDMESALLEQALFAVWQEYKNQATITHIAEWLLNHVDKKAQDLGTMLFPYTKDGIYGRFFNGQANVNFDSGVFVETLARRLRKYNGSLVVGTQSINDFYASTGALAAFENSDCICLLSQKKESIEQLKKTNRIALNGHMESQLASVKTKHGEYAEVMIYGPSAISVRFVFVAVFFLLFLKVSLVQLL